MALVIEFVCDLPNGVHARPASHVEKQCNAFAAQIEWLNSRTGRKGDAKSALAIIGTGTIKGDACQLTISGSDEKEAHLQLEKWLRDAFPLCDEPIAQPAITVAEPLPESLTRLNPTLFHAKSVCAGSDCGILPPLTSLDLNKINNAAD